MSRVRGHQPESDPGQAAAEDGIVLLDGPNGVAVAMTIECAEATAANLQMAARQARRQRDGSD